VENNWKPIAAAFIIDVSNFNPWERLSPGTNNIFNEGLLKLQSAGTKEGETVFMPRLILLYSNQKENRLRLFKYFLN